MLKHAALRIMCGIAAAVAFATAAHAQSALDAIQKRGSVRVGWAIVYPAMYRDPKKNNELVGTSADIVQEMASSMSVKLELVEDNWSTLIAGLQSNKFDITIPSLALTLPRALAVSFSKPVTQSPVVIMVKKELAEKYKSWQDMDRPDVRLTLTLGSDADMFATRSMRNAQVLRVRAAPDSIAQMLTGRAEGQVISTASFPAIVAEHPEFALLPGPPVGFSKISFAMKAGDYRLREWVNYFIDEIRNTGVLLRILKKYGLDETSLVQRGN